MNREPIPTDVRRFLQSNSLSIPHIEMILLLRRGPAMAWAHRDIAGRLYVTEERAAKLLGQLEAMAVVERAEGPPMSYYYRPATPDLAVLLDRLDVVYSKQLVAVTKLVHAARDEAAEQFAKAFQLRKEE
jgi:hypothetical protein